MAKFIKIIDRDVEGVEREVLYPWDASSQAPLTNGFTVQTVYSATVTLTNDEIKALPTTRRLVVPAPGVGKMLQFESGSIAFDTTAGSYTFPSGASLQLVAGTSGTVEMTGIINLVAWTGYYTARFPDLWFAGAGDFEGYLVDARKEIALVENQGLYVMDAYNGVADYTDGHASNTMSVTVNYSIKDV